MFHMSRSRLIGMSAADLIPDLFEKSAPGNNRTRRLVNLAQDSSWRPHQMTDADGHSYAVELCLSCVVAEGQNIFLAHLHRPVEVATD